MNVSIDNRRLSKVKIVILKSSLEHGEDNMAKKVARTKGGRAAPAELAHAQRKITFDDFVRWGALKEYSEKQVRTAFFRKDDSVTLAQVLSRPINVECLACIAMREELIPRAVLHDVAVKLVRSLLARLTKDGVYIDFRTRRLVDTAQRWVDGEVSLGELNAARRLGHRAWEDVALLQDTRVSAGARAALSITHPSSSAAVCDALRDACVAYGSRADHAAYGRQMLAVLKEHSKPGKRGAQR